MAKATSKGWKVGNMYLTSRMLAEVTIETRAIEKQIFSK